MSESIEPSAPPSRPAGEEPKTEERAGQHGILSNTWELELLISGAVVFALMQVPEVLDRKFMQIMAHFSGWSRTGLFLGYIYLGAIVYILIFSFLLHLTMRAYWVGLIGLDSVFPLGVRWEKVTTGPITRRVYSELLPSLRSMIVRTDRFCSVIFSFAFLFVLFFLLSIVFLGIFGLAAWGVSRLFFGGEHLKEIFWTMMLLFVVPLSLFSFLDSKRGARLNPEGRPARWIERGVRFAYHSQLTPLFGTIFYALVSNVRKWMLYTFLVFVIFGTIISLAINIAVGERGLSLSGLGEYAYLPDGSTRDVEPDDYEDQREKGRVYPRAPSIQSDVIRGPYVRLFIPYSPERHNAAFRKQCPELKPIGEEESPPAARKEAAAAAVLQCLAKIHRVSLDGKPLPALDFFFYTHPESGLRGILGYIPTAGLARGSHLLQVEPVPPAEPSRRKTSREPHRIRFWL